MTSTTKTTTNNDDIYCGACGSVCAETRKEVKLLVIEYDYRCCECGELAVIQERRCNCGSEQPAICCPEGAAYCG